MTKKAIGFRMSEPDLSRLDEVCGKYGYSRARLIETIYAKCAVVIENHSLMFLLDKLEEIQKPAKSRRML